MKKIVLSAAALALFITGCGVANSEEIGAVDTVFKLIGPDHKIVVEAYDDPKVAGVTCYVSRAKTGVLKALWGWQKTKPKHPSPAAKPA